MTDEKQLDETSEAFATLKETWRTRASDMTLETLPAFLRELMHDYKHDYGTVVYALAIGAVATCWAMNKESQGGITGFQASAVVWRFLDAWTPHPGPKKLIRYELMLYPQYAANFAHTMGKETWDWLREEAQRRLLEDPYRAAPAVKEHWQAIANGAVPFGYSIVEES